MMTHFLFIGGPEIFVILLLVVLLFGADKIPEIARGLGKGIRQVKDATNDIKREINSSIDVKTSHANENQSKSVIKDVIKEVEEAKKSIDNSVFGEVKKSVEGVKKNISDLTGPIKRSR